MLEIRRERAYSPEQQEAFKQQVLEVARAHMAAEGGAALSLRAIARDLGITAPALYRYFADRDALITALIVEAFNGLSEALETADSLQPSTAFKRRMGAIIVAYRTWALAKPNEFLLLFGTPIPAYEAPDALTNPPAQRAFTPFVVPLAEAHSIGAYHPPASPPTVNAFISAFLLNAQLPTIADVVYGAAALWASMHGLVTLEITGHLPPVVGDSEANFSAQTSRLIEATGLPPDP